VASRSRQASWSRRVDAGREGGRAWGREGQRTRFRRSDTRFGTCLGCMTGHQAIYPRMPSHKIAVRKDAMRMYPSIKVLGFKRFGSRRMTKSSPSPARPETARPLPLRVKPNPNPNRTVGNPVAYDKKCFNRTFSDMYPANVAGSKDFNGVSYPLEAIPSRT